MILLNTGLIDLKKKKDLTYLESCVHCQQNKFSPVLAMHGVLLVFDLVISESKCARSPSCKSSETRVYEVTLIMKDYKMWLELSFIELALSRNWIGLVTMEGLHYSHVKRDKVTQRDNNAEIIYLPWHYIIHEDPNSVEWTRHDCSRRDPIPL